MKSTGRSDSLLQKAKECYITGGTRGLEAHHLFPGSRRQASDRWGLWIWLRHDWPYYLFYLVLIVGGLLLARQLKKRGEA